MATYNYIRPHWANGQKAVHDAPNWVVATIEGMLADAKSARKEGLLRVQADYGVGLRVAWIQCPVSLKVDGGIGAYRTALYVHAIARDVDDPEPLTRDVARRLLQSVYGSPIETLIEEQQRYLEVLEHPQGLEVATSLFVRKEHLETLEAEAEPEPAEWPNDRRSVPRRFGERGASATMSAQFSAEVDDALERLKEQAWAGQRPSERREEHVNVYLQPAERTWEDPAEHEAVLRRRAQALWLHTHRTVLLMSTGFVVAAIALAFSFLR